MAVEAVGLVASILTIADATYMSLKHLYELVDKFRTASETLEDLHTELWAVQQFLQSLGDALRNTNDRTLSNKLKMCLQDLKPTMEACTRVCNEFSKNLAQITLNSRKDDIRWRDKIRFALKEKGIVAFKYRLSSHKLTISIALQLVTLVSTDQNQQILGELQNTITTGMSKISGQIQGLEMNLQCLSNETVALQHETEIDALRAQEIGLRQCLKMCTTAVDAVPARIGSAIKDMESFNTAKQLVVLTSGKLSLVDKMSARDQSSQMLIDRVKEGDESGLIESFFGHQKVKQSEM